MADFSFKLSNPSELKEMRKALSKAGAGDWTRGVQELVARRLKTYILQGFDGGTSPEGQKWAPLKWRKGKPLLLTYKLKNSVKVNVFRNQIKFESVSYGEFHQYGTARIPQRNFFPKGEMPDEWASSIQDITYNFLSRLFGV